MTQKVIILEAKTYKMAERKDEQGNIQPARNGLTGWYYPEDNLEDTTNPRTDGTTSKGTVAIQFSLPHDQAFKLEAVPGVYDFKMKMDSVAEKNAFGGTKYIQKIVPVDILQYHGIVALQQSKPKN